ncbi:hypothetical protein OG762_01755 [Streptomyces sp. NBC_01136]|uniref:hypothetical protein n=1 Tax=unclassified Streptomyces TaxID=2593676 RepID=UPI00324AD92C|nr:hypothetical protein OG762_01755 [Streptomyces sp. NBC_01136]
MRSLTALRTLLVLLGLGLCGFGVFQFVDRTAPGPGDAVEVLEWLAGAVAIHDGLLVPAVLAVGLLVTDSPVRAVLRGGLLSAGCLSLIALPMMLRAGKSANATVLPLNYVLNWGIVMSITLVVTASVSWARLQRSRRSAGRGKPGS